MTLNEALQIIRGIYFNATWLNDKANEAFYKVIKLLEEKKGVWLRSENSCYSPFDNSHPYTFQCSICYNKNDKPQKYCPYCGREMESIWRVVKEHENREDPSHPFAEDVMMRKE